MLRTNKIRKSIIFSMILLLFPGLRFWHVKGSNDVRLVGGGNLSSQGRVEVFRRGTWGRVCYHHWDLRDANVVCRQLGFKGALSATSSAGFGKGKGNILMDNVHCAGNESSLTECEHSGEPLVYLGHSKDAIVVCRTARLVEEKSAREGLVQVYHNNTWGWVCADQWNKRNADVVCRMMDFDGALSAFLYREKRRTRNSRVWLKNLRCTGNESSLFECSHEGLGSHNCEVERKAGVLCRSKVRLVVGSNVASQGRVEVFYSGTWGRVCYDFWDLRDANVVCSQLGFEAALSATSSASFGRGKGHLWMDHVDCTGNERSLTECEHSAGPLKYCRRYKLAGVVCRTARLVEERSPREGLVQVYHNNTWIWVCADQWDKHDADVACRMMYFDGSLSAFSNKFGPAKPVVWINKMQCTGNESSLFSCEHDALGTHDCKDKAGVVCRPKVRLVGWGNVTSQGRVEVFFEGSWGSVCGSGWGIKEANVVCRQLGFQGAVAAVTSASGFSFMYSAQCDGNETSLTECDITPPTRCRRNRAACVVCISDPGKGLSNNGPKTKTNALKDPEKGLSNNGPKTKTNALKASNVYVSPTKTQVPVYTVTMIVLGVLPFVSLVVTGYVSWRLCHHLYRKKEHIRKDKQETIEMVEEQNAVNVSRESETPLYSRLSSVTSSHYQGLQRMNACYENSDVAQMKKKNELEAYEEIGQASSDAYATVSPQLPTALGKTLQQT